jgi:N-acetylneuraminic acid mutarotase
MAHRFWIHRIFGLNCQSRPARHDRDRNVTRGNPRLMLEELETRTLLSPVVSVLPIQPREGVSFSGPVATFVDPGRSDPASTYHAVVDWGDGHTDLVTPSLVNGQWTVTDSHKYTEEASRRLRVEVTNNATALTAAGATLIQVVDQSPVAQALSIAPRTGQPFSGAVATFTDPAGAEPSGNYTAAIDWGDGTTPGVGAITVSGGVFTVSGSHTYTVQGSVTLRVTVTDDGGVAGANTWGAEANMAGARDTLAAAAGGDGRIYVVGGSDHVNLLRTLQAYDPSSNTWTSRADMPTDRYLLAAAPGPDGRIYAFGGLNFDSNFLPNQALNTVEAYDSAHDTWTTLASMPSRRYALAAALGANGLIYVFGGDDYNGNHLATVEAYDPAHDTWTTKTSMPTARDYLAAAPGPDGLIYVFGGRDSSDFPVGRVEAYDPATDTWTTKADMPTARADLAAAPGTDGLIYVLGGDSNAQPPVVAKVEAYDPLHDTWTTEPSMPSPRDSFAAAPGADGRIHVFGGLDTTGGGLLSATAGYQPAGRSGTDSTTVPLSAPPVQMTAAGPFAGTEGQTSAVQALATFTDPAGAGPLSDYAAQVDWGDGSGFVSDANVTISAPVNGVFTVSGGHRYADEDGVSGPIRVQVLHKGTVSDPVAVTRQLADPAAVAVAAAGPFTATEGQASAVQPLATFTDPAGAEPLADYGAQVNWGDGNGFVGDASVTIWGPVNGAFTVAGSHRSADEDNLAGQVQVRILHEGTTSNTTVITLQLADPAVQATSAPTPFSATEGQSSAVQVLATFTDPGGAEPPADYAAQVDWRDGAGFVVDPNVTISGPAGGVFTVSGSHRYSDAAGVAGQVQVRVVHEGSVSNSVGIALNLIDPPVLAAPAPGSFTAIEGQASAVQTLATFTDPSGALSLAQYSAQADWGDGNGFVNDPNVMISGPAGDVFTVSGSHRYADEDNLAGQVQVRIVHEGATSNGVSIALQLSDPAAVVAAAPGPFTATEGQASPVQPLATFSDPGGPESLADYSALVDWGDGNGFVSDASVTISGPVNGVFTIAGSHRYAEEDSVASHIQVRILHEGTTSNVAPVALQLTDPAVQATAAALPFSATEGQTSAVQPLATFTDPGGPESVADYSAQVDWGEGGGFVSDPNVTISAPAGGVFTVSGGHRYVQDSVTGQVQVRILHGGTTSNSVNLALQLADTPVQATAATGPFGANEGQTSAVQSLATFTDPGGAASLAAYSARVNWGDGNGFVSDPNVTITGPVGGVFTVSGSHRYADEDGLSGQVQVKVLHGETTSNTVHLALRVSDPAVVGMAAPVAATAGAPFSGTVATFTEQGGAEPNDGTHYAATISWGDNTASPGTITYGNGTFTVSGSHTYAAPGGYTIRTTINHEAVPTVVTSAATVSSLGLYVQSGQTAEIGFWHNKHGQALIDSFNGGPDATALSAWLAASFPNLYGASAGSNNQSGKTNAEVAAFYLSQFDLHGPKVEAQVLATALNVYATTLALGGTAAQAYGFAVSAGGLGARSFNVGDDGSAFGVANRGTLNVYQLLLAANQAAVQGVLFSSNRSAQHDGADLFGDLNEAGEIRS